MQHAINRVTRVIADQMGINADDIVITSPRFREELGLDSLDEIEMVMALEEEFMCEIRDEDAERFMNASVMEVAEYFESGKFPDVAAQSKTYLRSPIQQPVVKKLPQRKIGAIGAITVTVDDHSAHVKVDGQVCVTVNRSNGNIEDLCRLLMKSSTK